MNPSELALFSRHWQQRPLFPLPNGQENSRSKASSEPSSSPSPKQKSEECARPRSAVTMMVSVNDAGNVVGEDHRNAKYLDSDIEHAIELRQEGYSFREISLMMDMPIRTIRGYVDGTRRNQSVAGWKKIKRYV